MPSALGLRSIGSVAVVLVAILIVFAPWPILLVLLLALAYVATMEMYALLSREHVRLNSGLGVALTWLLVLAAAVDADASPGHPYLDVAVFLALVLPGAWGMRDGPRAGDLQRWAFSGVGALYVGWPLAHIQLLRALPRGAEWLVFAIACTWATDTGAYLVGSLVGRHKLIPRISPGKTVEGSTGAALLTVVVGAVIAPLLGLHISTLSAALLALALSIVAQAGDLAESYLKRIVGVKDTGHLIPGHGGLLDRIDSLLWVVVVTYYVAVVLL